MKQEKYFKMPKKQQNKKDMRSWHKVKFHQNEVNYI